MLPRLAPWHEGGPVALPAGPLAAPRARRAAVLAAPSAPRAARPAASALLCFAQLCGCLRAREVAAQGRVGDSVGGGERAQALTARAAAIELAIRAEAAQSSGALHRGEV